MQIALQPSSRDAREGRERNRWRRTRAIAFSSRILRTAKQNIAFAVWWKDAACCVSTRGHARRHSKRARAAAWDLATHSFAARQISGRRGLSKTGKPAAYRLI